MSGHGGAHFAHFLISAAMLSSSVDAAPAERACPTQVNDIDFALKDPVQTEPAQLSTVLAPGADVAVQLAAFEPELQETTGAISVSGPIKVNFGAGTRIGYRSIDSRRLPCVFWGLEAYEPPVDDEGRPFPAICLIDKDGDGSYEQLRMFAYKAQQGKGIIEAAIAPVKLRPHHRPVADKPFMQMHRRLRVESIDDRKAVLISELAFTTASPYGPQEPTYRPQGNPMQVPLREGVTEVGGVPLTLARIGDQWIATPRGNARPWTGLECDRARISILPQGN